MRGTDERSGSLFSYVDLETRVSTDHPLRGQHCDGLISEDRFASRLVAIEKDVATARLPCVLD